MGPLRGRRPEAPARLRREQWLALDGEARADHDEARLDYHTRLAIVATPTIRQVASTGRRLVLLNRHEVSARRGLIVTGPSGTGKTTAVTQLGRSHERAVRRRHPEEQTRLPVVYVTVPPAATPGFWPSSSPASSASRCPPAPTRPRSPTPCAACWATYAPSWSSWTRSTT